MLVRRNVPSAARCASQASPNTSSIAFCSSTPDRGATHTRVAPRIGSWQPGYSAAVFVFLAPVLLGVVDPGSETSRSRSDELLVQRQQLSSEIVDAVDDFRRVADGATHVRDQVADRPHWCRSHTCQRLSSGPDRLDDGVLPVLMASERLVLHARDHVLRGSH